MNISSILKRHNLRDTQTRRLVLQALNSAVKPMSKQDIFSAIQSDTAVINLTTIYRMLETFIEKGIVHLHKQSGGYVLCSIDDHNCHHVLLSCQVCGTTKECEDAKLCATENTVAKNAGFTPTQHFSEIVGLCNSCA